jgi:hypothetical protein
MKRLLLLSLLLAAAGCKLPTLGTGGSTTDDLNVALGAGTSPYAVLDLADGSVSYLTAAPDLAGNAAYRDGKMVFRRVGSGAHEALVAVLELTQAQWQRLDPVHSEPWKDVPTTVVPSSAWGSTYPAYNLSAEDLTTALAAFSSSSGARLAIPSALQWETAAGAQTGYTWGATADREHLVDQAVVRETALNDARLAAGTAQIDAGGPAATGSRSANRSGIYDLHGNVWEWIDAGSAIRGGSWYDPAANARIDADVGFAQGLLPNVDHALIGARLVLIP